MDQEDPTTGDVRAQLRAIKGAKKWKNKTFAEAAGLTTVSIGRFLRNDGDMPLRRVETMLEGLGYRLVVEKIKE